MTAEEMIIAAVRLAGALLVLRWAFAGSLAAIAIDFSDLFLMNLIDLGGVRNYQAFDKWLDLAYMVTFLWVALRWSGPVRTIAVGLFAYRIAGVVAFEVVGARWVLLLFPNVFEFWFGIRGRDVSLPARLRVDVAQVRGLAGVRHAP